MEKGQNMYSAMGGFLSSPYATLVSRIILVAARDAGLLILGLHVALAPIGRFSVDALLRRGCSGEEPYQA